MALKKRREHEGCWAVVMHFRDLSEARAVLDASSLDDARMWKVSLARCGE